MSEPRLIKRYSNRKLYDTARSSYVTLEEIAELINAGEEIRIVDKRSGEDLTAVTMAQILVEQEKRQKRAGPFLQLRELIQSGGELFSRTTRAVTEPVTQVRSSIEESWLRLIRSSGERAEETRAFIRGWVEHQAQVVEELQGALDERVKVVTDGLTVVGRLQRELRQVSERLDAIEARLAAGEGAGPPGPLAPGEGAGPADPGPADPGPPAP